MDTAVKKKKKPPDRPHWKGMYHKAEQERERLAAEVAKLKNLFESDLNAAYTEIGFLRKTVSGLTAVLQDAVKVQD